SRPTGSCPTRGIDEDGYSSSPAATTKSSSGAGYRIGPFEWSQRCSRTRRVAEAAAIGVPDELRGEVLGAYVVTLPGTEADDERAAVSRSAARGREGRTRPLRKGGPACLRSAHAILHSCTPSTPLSSRWTASWRGPWPRTTPGGSARASTAR